ncbi:MAG TPA: DUF2125 domain-containing protein [Dongiaceae bacterium]|nr:DUF2125 domain-containing protein [Dongiaceae bacterium]
MHNRASRNRAIPMLAIAGVVLLLVLAGGYYAYWRYVARELESGIDYWAADQRAHGSEVAFVWDGISGFPFAFKARFQQPNVKLQVPGGVLEWASGFLAAEMSPWDLKTVRISSPAQQVVRLHDQSGQTRLIVAAISGEIRFSDAGLMRGIAAELQLPDVTLPDGLALAADQAKLRLALPDTPPTDYSQPFAMVAVDVSKLLLPPNTRLLTTDPVEQASLDAIIRGPVAVPVDVTMAPALTQILADWRDQGGDVEVKSFSFAQGPLNVGGEATLALDGNLQPLGAGTVTASGLSETVEILLRDGLIPADRAMVARATAKALERTGAEGKAEAKFALSLQNGIVSFGPAPLVQVPPIEWE